MSAAHRVDAGRLAVLALTAVVLLGSVDFFRVEEEDAATFDAATSCGPAGAVTLATELKPGGCGPQGYDLVHAVGGPQVGLPGLGEIDHGQTVEATQPGDVILDGRIVLVGTVTLAGSSPAITLERRCRLAREAPRVLGVSCEGPDPEAACTGTLTLRAVTP